MPLSEVAFRGRQRAFGRASSRMSVDPRYFQTLGVWSEADRRP